MSEVVTTVNPMMPPDYGYIKAIEIKRLNDGSIRYNGIIDIGEGDALVHRRIQLPSLETIWGHSPSLRVDYMRDPENWVSPYATEPIAEPQTELEQLRQRVAELEAELEAIRGVPVAPVDTAADTDDRVAGTSAVGAGPDRIEEETAREPGAAVAEDREVIDTTEPRDRTVVEDDRNLPFRDRMVNRWYGMNAKVGGFILGRNARPYRGGYRVYDRSGTTYRDIDEDEYDDTYESQRRAGAIVVLGGLALFAGGVLIGWLLHKNGNGHVINEYNESIRGGKIPADQFNQIIDQINDNQTDLSAQEARDHAQEMDRLNEIAEQVQEDTQLDKSNHRLLEHINRHLHNLKDVNFRDLDISSFNTDTFYGRTPNEAIRSALDVIRDNNIQVRGVTPDRIEAIKDDMMQNHWRIASGMQSANQQYIVDVANDWKDGLTSNANASAAQGFRRNADGSTLNGWQNFMLLASRHGIKFSGTAT